MECESAVISAFGYAQMAHNDGPRTGGACPAVLSPWGRVRSCVAHGACWRRDSSHRRALGGPTTPSATSFAAPSLGLTRRRSRVVAHRVTSSCMRDNKRRKCPSWHSRRCLDDRCDRRARAMQRHAISVCEPIWPARDVAAGEGARRGHAEPCAATIYGHDDERDISRPRHARSSSPSVHDGSTQTAGRLRRRRSSCGTRRPSAAVRRRSRPPAASAAWARSSMRHFPYIAQSHVGEPALGVSHEHADAARGHWPTSPTRRRSVKKTQLNLFPARA